MWIVRHGGASSVVGAMSSSAWMEMEIEVED